MSGTWESTFDYLEFRRFGNIYIPDFLRRIKQFVKFIFRNLYSPKANIKKSTNTCDNNFLCLLRLLKLFSKGRTLHKICYNTGFHWPVFSCINCPYTGEYESVKTVFSHISCSGIVSRIWQRLCISIVASNFKMLAFLLWNLSWVRPIIYGIIKSDP